METLVKEDMGGTHRTLLCQGPVELTSGKKMKKRHLSLFDHVLVVSSNLNKKRFKIKCILPRNNLWVVENVELVRKNQTCPCKNLFLFWPDGNFLASFHSIEQKDPWYYFLRRSIDSVKKNVKKRFSLKIFTEDIPSCDSPLCVTATNIDTVNDIIEKLLPMIRMPNREDYQLWFCPGREEAPRALQSYEYPHKILMTHLQNNCKRWNSKISTAFPILPGLFVKDLILDREGQFILKPREARSRQQSEFSIFLQISIIQTMIDNYVDIFGAEDHIIGDHNQNSSDDIKMSVNTAASEGLDLRKLPANGKSGGGACGAQGLSWKCGRGGAGPGEAGRGGEPGVGSMEAPPGLPNQPLSPAPLQSLRLEIATKMCSVGRKVKSWGRACGAGRGSGECKCTMFPAVLASVRYILLELTFSLAKNMKIFVPLLPNIKRNDYQFEVPRTTPSGNGSLG
ncbi:rho GTPase-activating protein 20-like [Apodemus sylvaticus]|uniref:rho GTPase-activating protein 20-like n=1 Tax=Apodemus sylvaticus TaxID=10129 RepID=UPI002244BCEC|nr:rho GTPase-activating protein 20-like [Apodemus sylvaticus]